MTDIAVTDITDTSDPNISVGTGVFDVLMTAVEAHIERQFQKQRITGEDYATVYLGSLQAVLQQSVQFILNEQTAGKQSDLLDQQILEQTEKVLTQAEVTTKTQSEIALLDQKKITELAQTSDTATAAFGSGSTALTGVMGSQRQLYKTQTQGFIAKHHVDTVKQLGDMWSVAYSINDGTTIPAPAGVTSMATLDAEVSEMKAAMDNIS